MYQYYLTKFVAEREVTWCALFPFHYSVYLCILPHLRSAYLIYVIYLRVFRNQDFQ